MDIPAFLANRVQPAPSHNARPGNANSKRIPDADVLRMRSMYHDEMASVTQVQRAFPHVNASYVLRILNGEVRTNVVQA